MTGSFSFLLFYVCDCFLLKSMLTFGCLDPSVLMKTLDSLCTSVFTYLVAHGL